MNVGIGIWEYWNIWIIYKWMNEEGIHEMNLLYVVFHFRNFFSTITPKNLPHMGANVDCLFCILCRELKKIWSIYYKLKITQILFNCSQKLIILLQIKPKRPVPVLVYLHGGGFRSGNGDMYGPHLLMDKPLVMVSLNHRLGIFGEYS